MAIHLKWSIWNAFKGYFCYFIRLVWITSLEFFSRKACLLKIDCTWQQNTLLSSSLTKLRDIKARADMGAQTPGTRELASLTKNFFQMKKVWVSFALEPAVLKPYWATNKFCTKIVTHSLPNNLVYNSHWFFAKYIRSNNGCWQWAKLFRSKTAKWTLCV